MKSSLVELFDLHEERVENTVNGFLLQDWLSCYFELKQAEEDLNDVLVALEVDALDESLKDMQQHFFYLRTRLLFFIAFLFASFQLSHNIHCILE